MSKPVNETEDWKLTAWLSWRAKPKTIVCPTCNGRGEVGGGFKSMDGPRQCDSCHGTGSKTVYPDEKTKPEIPAELRQRLHEAWLKYWNEQPPEALHQGENI